MENSKLDSFVAWEYLLLLIDKLIGWLVPVRIVMFAAVGADRSDCSSHDPGSSLNGIDFPECPSTRHRCSNHEQLYTQQYSDLSGSTASRYSVFDWTSVVFRDLQRWRCCQCRHRSRCVRAALCLVALGPSRHCSRSCLELRAIVGFHLAPHTVMEVDGHATDAFRYRRSRRLVM